MTWEQQLMALKALDSGDVKLFMRHPGDWMVLLPNVERKESNLLSSGGISGRTPEDAVDKTWRWATDPQFYLVVNAMSARRREVRWNGFMWSSVEVIPEAAE